ncbi:hypothetical protein A5893_08425 [Pedobacter psychrophilus]|uniref:DUF4783 domain-containing protein n=1 Tax=Pedobacter psychrophilus TaxID=1826909 RepID=A0A179DEY1_9SPHI|nr:DUF4783 domain-containing protein [Pedobacter psychrophilus]OAQ39606.1 hypothetical protein A5893_08425 [Pedobacter psychrophilus]
MKYSLTLLFLMLFKVSFGFDVIDDLNSVFKNGDVKGLSAYFSNTIELSIMDQDDIYSANQANLILKDFFSKNPANSTKIIHKVVSNASYKFGVIQYNCAKGAYRISFELKGNGSEIKLTQIRIEENKN